MKIRATLLIFILLMSFLGYSQKHQSPLTKTIAEIDKTIEKGIYKSNWESLKKHVDPEWFHDAKFGIYTHWGPVTVGSTGGGSQWYGSDMYKPDVKTFDYHLKNFDDQNKVGYKDFPLMLTAQNFNAEEWADLFEQSGAKFAGPVAIHHDNFAMWDSKLTRWNSVAMGPKRDITGELEKAIRKRGLKYITTFHHGYAWRYFEPAFKYDGADPKYADLYTELHATDAPPSKEFQDLWLAMVYEVLGKYQPDLIWFDFEFFEVIKPEYQQKLFAATYNWAEKNKRTIGVCQKSADIREYTGIFDIERGREDDIKPYMWLTDSMVSEWFYDETSKAKPLELLIAMLVDIVSKNGCLLLNVGPTVDGKIPDKDREALLGMGKWLKINGEAIYSTRPWKVYGEGPTIMEKSGRFSEVTDKLYTDQDIRFTSSKDEKTLYAIQLGVPSNGVTRIKTLANNSKFGADVRISSVELLGYGPVKFERSNDFLEIKLPANLPSDVALSFKLKFQ